MPNLNTPFMIGEVEIPNRTILAPMAGVTNSAFRTIAKELGAGLVVMEMVSDKGIQYNNEKTLHMLHIEEEENPVSIQLFGSNADSLAHAAEFIQKNTKTNIVDINMGCPVNKIVKNEAGAKWLKDPDKIYSIISKVRSVLDIPLTVKMRTGWSDSSLAVENALAAEAAGVSALAMHGRTREQMYTGHADLETLHDVAQALTKIPFIANGDIRTVQDAKQRIEEVGADAVMIGRTAMGNPYIFHQINHYLETGEVLPDLSFEEKMKVAYNHLTRLIQLKGEFVAIREFRGLAPHYLRGTAGAAKLRGSISQAESLSQIKELLQVNDDTASTVLKR
ncbi:MAG: tRNA dihydrouridine synthase DusB [Streptococcus sp.]|nr:tRNA dihydrouridine synthase DusB [Streptococcus sp.]